MGIDDSTGRDSRGSGPLRSRGHPRTQLHRTRTLPPVPYREQQPTFIPLMLLASGAVPNGERWALEVKWDGCRAQVRHDGREVSAGSWLMTRQQRSRPASHELHDGSG